MTLRVLIIEDEERIASFLQEGLEAEGFSAVVARTGTEGIARTADDIEVVILDVMLPDTDEGKTEGGGPLRVIGPDRPHDPAQEAHFGAHWNAALQPGECFAYQGDTVEVVGRTDDGYDIEVTRDTRKRPSVREPS